jgi:hypothetical protein
MDGEGFWAATLVGYKGGRNGSFSVYVMRELSPSSLSQGKETDDIYGRTAMLTDSFDQTPAGLCKVFPWRSNGLHWS